MHAAVVESFDRPPAFREIPAPAARPDGVLVDLVASAIHPRVRSQAAGSHYTSTDELPLVPGVDGVGRAPDGALRYFVLPDTRDGAMAEQVVIDPRRSAVLPEGVDPVRIAAAMNPAMSSWMALTQRIALPAGARVLVLGATGSAGRLAVQLAKRLGASHVTAAGRDVRKLATLPALGADALIELGDGAAAGFAEAGRSLDVVLDYVWGDATAAALRGIVPAREDDGRPLHWVEIGSTGGLESPIPSAALRATDLRLVGSGQGSVSPRAIVAELPALAAEIMRGGYDVPTRAVPLRDVTAAWTARTDDRIVLVP
ncbi:quinone oxidoreductase family protein [Amnibacterium kyonggiense]|uniref:NADPH:quinone reductase-like Zn-dependent oxidoreductase n=1 Tax=Amnibacterium kyonggiense TaxID=595671 RepID=A0A4R7FRW3_9MICO|nr:zinc-binding alcohol dehydrogenase family protein [Amnibacterium kyonggiense]TDS80478.1 NADPH:quinone reductase-like Zn-dependent oxidoreductase [Amnibacterium kyonggiense]